MSQAANLRVASLAADRAVHRAFRWLHLNQLRLLQWQMQMLAIPAPPFGEEARARWFVDRSAELGLEAPRLDAIGNAVATLPDESLGQACPVVLVSAHLDTVFPADAKACPIYEGDLIRAPGACDNAAGLTGLLALAAALRDADIALPCTVLFAANVGEEGEGNLRGMRHLLEESEYAGRIAAVIALEGGGDALVIDRALGSRRFRITLSGPGGHSWADAAQPNPIFILAEALAALARLQLPSAPRTTLQVGRVFGGSSVNSIPASVSADLDIRSVAADVLALTEAEAMRVLDNTVREAQGRYPPTQPPLELKVDLIGDRPAAALDPESTLMQGLRAVDRHLQIATERRIGSTDANLPLAMGIPALAVGAGGIGGGIHTLNEWYNPAGREVALRRILLLLLDACATADARRISG